MKDKLKKLLMNTLKNTPSNKALMLMDFSINVDSTLGVRMKDHLDDLQQAVTELENDCFLRFEDGRGNGRFVRGLNFEDYFNQEKKDSVVNFNVGSVNGDNVQIGNNNSLVIEKGLQTLIKKINDNDTSDPEKERAKGTLKSLLSNPAVAAILGGAVSGLASLLG